MSHQSRKDNLIFEDEELGLTPKDLKILSMDPYMVGSEGEYRDATWAAGKWDTMMGARNKPIHIRGFHYWCYNQVTKPDGTLYGADLLKDWRWLLKSSQVARYLGIGEWRNLIDVKHLISSFARLFGRANGRGDGCNRESSLHTLDKAFNEKRGSRAGAKADKHAILNELSCLFTNGPLQCILIPGILICGIEFHKKSI